MLLVSPYEPEFVSMIRKGEKDLKRGERCNANYAGVRSPMQITDAPKAKEHLDLLGRKR